MIRFFIVPDMLQNAPMSALFNPHPHSACTNFPLRLCRFKRTGVNAMRGRGIGTARGRATIMRGPSILGIPFVSFITDHLFSSVSSQRSTWTWHAYPERHQAVASQLPIRISTFLSENVNYIERFPRRIYFAAVHLAALFLCTYITPKRYTRWGGERGKKTCNGRRGSQKRTA